MEEPIIERAKPRLVDVDDFIKAFGETVSILEISANGLYSSTPIAVAQPPDENSSCNGGAEKVLLQFDINEFHIRRAATALKFLNKADPDAKGIPRFISFLALNTVTLSKLADRTKDEGYLPTEGLVSLAKLLYTHSVSAQFGVYVLVTSFEETRPMRELHEIAIAEARALSGSGMGGSARVRIKTELYKCLLDFLRLFAFLEKHKVRHNAVLESRAPLEDVLELPGNFLSEKNLGSSRKSADVDGEFDDSINARFAAGRIPKPGTITNQTEIAYTAHLQNFRHACSYNNGRLPYRCTLETRGQDLDDLATVIEHFADGGALSLPILRRIEADAKSGLESLMSYTNKTIAESVKNSEQLFSGE